MFSKPETRGTEHQGWKQHQQVRAPTGQKIQSRTRPGIRDSLRGAVIQGCSGEQGLGIWQAWGVNPGYASWKCVTWGKRCNLCGPSFLSCEGKRLTVAI